jgi:hypothetical protein
LSSFAEPRYCKCYYLVRLFDKYVMWTFEV